MSQIKFITLPGTQSTSSPTGIALNLNPTTYLGAAYGSLGGKPVDSYVGLQTYQGDVGVCSRLNSLCKSDMSRYLPLDPTLADTEVAPPTVQPPSSRKSGA